MRGRAYSFVSRSQKSKLLWLTGPAGLSITAYGLIYKSSEKSQLGELLAKCIEPYKDFAAKERHPTLSLPFMAAYSGFPYVFRCSNELEGPRLTVQAPYRQQNSRYQSVGRAIRGTRPALRISRPGPSYLPWVQPSSCSAISPWATPNHTEETRIPHELEHHRFRNARINKPLCHLPTDSVGTKDPHRTEGYSSSPRRSRSPP